MEYQDSALPNVNATGAQYFDLEGRACFSSDSTAIRITRLLPYLMIILVSVVGNALVIVVVFRNRTMRRAVNFFIVNMALSDLLITVVYMPRVVGVLLVGFEWLSSGVPGQVFCKLVYYIHETAISVSILSAVSISGERFVAVARPYKALNNTKKTSRAIIALTWVVSAIIRLPILFANSTKLVSGKWYCTFCLDGVLSEGSSAIYHKVNLIVMYAVPLALMITLYSATIFILKRKKRPGNTTRVFPAQSAEVNKKVSKMVLVVLFAFLLCWILYFIVAVLISYNISISCELMYVRLVFAHFNCALTPVLYALFCENYRREFKSVLFLCPLARRRVRSASVISNTAFGAKKAWVLDVKDVKLVQGVQSEIGNVGPAF